MIKQYIINIDHLIKKDFPIQFREISIIGYKILAMILFFFISAFILKKVLTPVIKWIIYKFQNRFYIACYEQRVFRSLINFVPMLFCYWIIEDVFYRSKRFMPYINTTFNFLILCVIALFIYRLLRAIESYADGSTSSYYATALKAVGQSFKIVCVIAFIIISVSIFLRIKPGTIFTTLGAMTAIIILVFRDTILGFISGIHVATSKLFKIGDWVHITKYGLEGNILEINLLTTKIKNFDSTISTIPTYDLISGEVRNAQILLDNNTRRIKRSIFFSIKSFKFIDYAEYQRLQRIDILKRYFEEKKEEVSRLSKMSEAVNTDYLINGKQLTNIGIFRIYVLQYLEQHPNIDKNRPVMVRQLENTPTGMPLEIYCFTNIGVWKDFENIQSDIFDHILVAAADFGLDIVQTLSNSYK